MHYVPRNYQNNTLGFAGPIIGYTSDSGWAKRPIRASYSPPVMVVKPLPPIITYAPPETLIQAVGGMYTDPTHPYYSPSSMLTREQLQAMKDRAIAVRGELTDRQRYEGGDGIAHDLEQRAGEANATENAIEDSTGGVSVAKEAAKTNLVPLGIAAALIFFMK